MVWPLSALLALLASFLVSTYDVLLRSFMVSYYVVGCDTFRSTDEYLHARALKKTRRFVESSSAKFNAAIESGKVRVNFKDSFSCDDLAFATRVLHGKHGMPLPLVWAWRGFVNLMSFHSGHQFTTVTLQASGEVVGLFVEFRQQGMHHFITALVEHEASREHGIYIAKYDDLLSSCIRDAVPLLRLGPTTDELKAGLGGITLPVPMVGPWIEWAMQGFRAYGQVAQPATAS